MKKIQGHVSRAQYLFVVFVVIISLYLAATSEILHIVLQNIIHKDFHSNTLFVNILNLTDLCTVAGVLLLPGLINRYGTTVVFFWALILMIFGLAGVWASMSSYILYGVVIFLFTVGRCMGTLFHTLQQGNIGNKYRSTFQGVLSVLGGATAIGATFFAQSFGQDRLIYLFFALGLIPLIIAVKWISRGRQGVFGVAPRTAKEQAALKAKPRLTAHQKVMKYYSISHYILLKPEAFLMVILASLNCVFFSFMVFMGDNLHFTHTEITHFMTIIELGGLVIVLPLSWLADRFNVFTMYMIYLIAIIVGHVLVVFAGDSFIEIDTLYFCIAGLASILYSLSVAYLAKAFKKDELAHAYASRAIITSLVGIALNYCFGFILHKTGMTGISIAMSIVDGLGVFLMLHLRKKGHVHG